MAEKPCYHLVKNEYVIYDKNQNKFVWQFVDERGQLKDFMTHDGIVSRSDIFSNEWIRFTQHIVPRSAEVWENTLIKSPVFIVRVGTELRRISNTTDPGQNLLTEEIPKDMVHGKNDWIRAYPVVLEL